MSKGKCELCGKRLKAGEWFLQKGQDGKGMRVCKDIKACQNRILINPKGKQ